MNSVNSNKTGNVKEIKDSFDKSDKSDKSDNIFPEAVEIERNWDSEYKKKINNSKSELANYILKELNEFKNTGKNVEIELNRVNYSKIEKDIIKKMLFEKGWIVKTEIKSYNIPNWEYDSESGIEQSVYWHISKTI